MNTYKNSLIIAPHPDDEVLGCAGTILKNGSNKFNNYCVYVTNFSKKNQKLKSKKLQIKKVSKLLNFKNIFELNYPPSSLDRLPKKDLIDKFKKIIDIVKPNLLYVPNDGDSHSDHKIVFDCLKPFMKSFRYDFIKKIYKYETLSETNFSEIYNDRFKPNTWVDISKYINKKIEICLVYKDEFNTHPFPRSSDSVRSLAILRGSFANKKYAEAFQLIKSVE
jgi:LmbE family N-acetylglucosaminyl deacetylase